MSAYVIAPTGADILHYGKGHDDNPPGRGSGRYAWGTGNGEGAKQKAKITKTSRIKTTATKVKNTLTSDKAKKIYKDAIKIGTTAALTGLVTFGGFKVYGAEAKSLYMAGSTVINALIGKAESKILNTAIIDNEPLNNEAKVAMEIGEEFIETEVIGGKK
jgi:hypothetical protein